MPNFASTSSTTRSTSADVGDVGGEPLGGPAGLADRLRGSPPGPRASGPRPRRVAPHAASRTAIARPIPREAPVTRATWPLRSTRHACRAAAAVVGHGRCHPVVRRGRSDSPAIASRMRRLEIGRRRFRSRDDSAVDPDPSLHPRPGRHIAPPQSSHPPLPQLPRTPASSRPNTCWTARSCRQPIVSTATPRPFEPTRCTKSVERSHPTPHLPSPITRPPPSQHPPPLSPIHPLYPSRPLTLTPSPTNTTSLPSVITHPLSRQSIRARSCQRPIDPLSGPGRSCRGSCGRSA